MSIRGKASKYRGVYKCGRKWKSQVNFFLFHLYVISFIQHKINECVNAHLSIQIQVGGVQHYLGIFENEV